MLECIGALEVTYGHALAGGGSFRRVTTPEGSAAELTPATFLWFKPAGAATAIVHLHIGPEDTTAFPVEPPLPPPPPTPTSHSKRNGKAAPVKWVRMDKPIDRAKGLYVWYLALEWRQATDDDTLRPLKDIRVVRDVKDVPEGFECVDAPPLVTETTDAKGKPQELRSYVCYQRLDDEDLSGSAWTLAGQKSGTWIDVRDLASNRWRVGQIVHVSANECRISVATWSKKSPGAFRDEVVSFAMSRNRVAPLGTHTDLHLSPSYPLCRKQGSTWNLALKDIEQVRSDFDVQFYSSDPVAHLEYVKQKLLPWVEKSMVSLFYSNELAEQVSLFHQHVVKNIVTWFVGRGAFARAKDGTSSDAQSPSLASDEQTEVAQCLLSILRLVLSGMVAPNAAMFYYIKYGGSYATMKTPQNLVYTAYLTSTDTIAATPMRHPCRSTFYVDVVEVFLQAGGFRFMLDRVAQREVPLVEIAVIAMILLSAKSCLIIPQKRKRNLSASSSGRRKSSLSPENQQIVEDFFRDFLQSTLARLRRMRGEELKDEDGLVEHILGVLDAIYRDGAFLGSDDSLSQPASTSEGSSPEPSAQSTSSSTEIAFAEVFEMFHLDLSKKYICCPFLAQRLLGVARLSDLIVMAQRRDSLQKKSSFNLKRTAVGAATTAASSLGLVSGSSSSDSNGASSTKWLRYKFILEWLVDSDVIEVILGQSEACTKYGMREGVHLELLKRSRSLLEALAQSGYLTEAQLSLLWRAAMSQLRTGRKAVFDLLISLCNEMTADMLDIVMVLLTQVAVCDYDELLIQFIQKLIEIASKNAVEAENGAKKSTITSFVGVHSKRTQGAQRESETSNKIVGLGLSLLWNAIEHHSSEQNSVGTPARSVTSALAVAFAESLNHVHRTWAGSGLSSSSAKEQQQLLSQYVTKCVGLIKTGGQLTEMAMVITQKVVENYGRAASSASSTLAIARSTFQSGGVSSTGTATTPSDFLKDLQSKHSLISLVVSDIERSVRDHRERRKQRKWRCDDSTEVSCQLVVQKRLTFLAFVVTSSDLELSYKDVERLWQCFVKGSEPQGKEDQLDEEEVRDIFFKWLCSVVADPGDFVQRTYAGKHALTPATTEELFGDLAAISMNKVRTVELNVADMSASAFWLFERLFRYVNVTGKRMSCDSSGGTSTTGSGHVTVESMELKGYERLFDIALCAKSDVSDAAMNYLIHLHMRLGSKLVKREVWSDFARGCVSRLSKIKASGGDLSTNQESTRLLLLLNTFLFQSTVQDGDNNDASSAVESLTVYVRTQDGRAAAPFYFKLKRTVLVGELRDLIARDSSHPADRVRLINDVKVKLTSQGHDRLTLEKAQVIRISGGVQSAELSKAAIAVANTRGKRKNFVEAVLLNRPDSDTVGHVERPVLVGSEASLGKEMNDWEAVKFELSSAKTLRLLQQFLSMSTDTSEEAWKLLKQLNYDSSMEKKIRTLDDALNIDGSMKKSAPVLEWGKFLDITSPPKLLYQVELVERFALTKPPSSPSSAEADHHTPPKDRDDRNSVANAWCESFSLLGGQAHLKDFVLALDTQQLVSQKRSLTAMCLARVFGLLDHLIGLDVQSEQFRKDGSYESLVIKIFDTLRTIQSSQIMRVPELKSDRSVKVAASHQHVAFPTYVRPDLRVTDEDESSETSIEAMLVVGALRLLSTTALAHGGSLPDDKTATITLLRAFADSGSILLEYLVKPSEVVVRKEAYRIIADLCSPAKNRHAADRSQCRRFFLSLLANSEELSPHAEYYQLYTHLINLQVDGTSGSEDDLTWFDFLPASVKLCRSIVHFPEVTVKQPSPSQHFKVTPSQAQKGKKDPAPDAVYEVLLSTLLAVLRKIPPVLADGHHSPTGEPKSLREVVVGTINGDEGIIEEIFTHGLFPANASVTGEKNEDEERSAQYYLKQPKCKSDSCRKVAFELLQELATESVDGLKYLFGQMTEHHSLTPPPDPSTGVGNAVAAPLSSKKKNRSSVTKALDYHNLERGKYVGLKNLGCTCYMNSTVQAFFMIPRFRRQILRYSSQPNGLVYQLQSVFAHLEGSAKAYYNPKALTMAMKTWEGEPIDVNEQQDASEFLTSFFQQIESEMNGRNEVAESSDSGSTLGRSVTDESILNSFFGGVFSNELVAEGDRYSERFEPFHFISVPVRDRKNLQESLDSWAEGDKVSYTWESPAAESTGEVEKVTLDTHKRISIHKLPDQLIIHLKRFEFDFEAMQQTKIHDRFEFPMELDMYPYTKEGQAEQRSRKRSQSRSGQKSDESVDNRSRAPEYYQYELVGTVVHMGTAHSGHYYSFLRDHDASMPANDGSGQQQWYEFNDTHVTPFDAADIPEECFGGQDDEQDDASTALSRKRKKTRSSFMLFYSRRQPKLHLDTFAPSTRKPLSVYATVLCFIVRLKTRAHSRMEYLRSRSLILAPEPIREQILLENRMFWRKRYLFNRHYLDFTFELLAGCTSEPAHDGTISFDGPIEVRLQALQLATRFVFGTLWQSGDVEAVLKWKPALCALYRDEVAGSQWLLSTLRDNDALLLEFLVSNEHAEVRELMAVVLEEAISTTSHSAAIAISQNQSRSSPGASPEGRSSRRRRSSTTLPPSFEFMFLLFRLMPSLLTVPVSQHHQYFEVLLSFALTGQNECTFTVVNSVVGAIGALLTGLGNTQPLLQGELKRVKGRTILKRIELDHVQLKLMSLLIRIVPPPEMDVPGALLLPSSMAANPNAPALPAGDHDVLLSERFIMLLTQHASHYTRSTKSLEQIVIHLCWQSRRITGMFMDAIMNGIESEDHDDVKPYFRTLNTIYKTKDSLAQERLEDGMTKLVAIMASQQKYYKATEASLDMLTRLAKRHPRSVAHWIRKHQSSCAWMEKWLLAHRGPEGYLQQGRTALVKPNSTSSWATVNPKSDQLMRNIDRTTAKLLPRVRSMLDSKDGMETFYDSDDNPNRLVGKRVRVKWAKEKWYEGVVDRFDERLYEHLIVYDDGDRRQYRMSDKVFYVVEAPAPGADANAAAPSPLRRRESSSADL